ncbi:MAG: efflux RND transporter periplasmic adaptor subunit [Steroidobacteraceae bacterium]
MPRRTLVVVAAIVVVAGGWFYYVSRPTPVDVEVVAVERGGVAETVTNTRAGTIEACRRAKLAPPMGGQIAKLHVKKGDTVKRNQLLLELWNEDTRAQITLAERDVVASQARAEEACVAASVSRREANRYASMLDRKLIAVETAERSKGDADSREAACRAATQNTMVSRSRVDAARAALDRTQLRAPFDGVVAEINGELGEFVTPSPIGIATPPAVDVVDTSCIYVTAPIDEVDAPRIREGMPARVTLDAFRDKRFPAHVRRVAPYVLEVEKQARTVEIEAELDTRDDRSLLPGYSADVEVILDERADVLRVPTRAVLEGKRVYVFDAAANIVRLREVTTGLSNWEYTEIASGLALGDRVVTTVDREKLADGVAARIGSPDTPKSKPKS